jgi:tRNA 2-thiouridine synthesizing protein A
MNMKRPAPFAQSGIDRPRAEKAYGDPGMADKTLDTKGLNCPLPILKAKKAIADVPVGGTLEVLATELVESSETGGVYRFLIKRTA